MSYFDVASKTCQALEPGQYNQDFVNEFRVFTDELKRFFNCSGALERLDALRPTMDEDDARMVDEMHAAMRALEGAGAGGLAEAEVGRCRLTLSNPR
jgi:hypothetical protein